MKAEYYALTLRKERYDIEETISVVSSTSLWAKAERFPRSVVVQLRTHFIMTTFMSDGLSELSFSQ